MGNHRRGPDVDLQPLRERDGATGRAVLLRFPRPGEERPDHRGSHPE